MTVKTLFAGLSAAMLVLAPLALAQSPTGSNINFGDDGSMFSKDGECDDPRFSGTGMTDTKLLESDRMHDATDCKAAFDAGKLQLIGTDDQGSTTPSANISSNGIDFGDDGGDYTKDGECDDPRFTGPGMTTTPLLDEDIRHDATDCRTAYEAGKLQLDRASTNITSNGVSFGDDRSMFSKDGECDDPRFSGTGMTDTKLLESDKMHDATDCKAAYDAGKLQLIEAGDQASATPSANIRFDGINFGDDGGDYTNDDECDDPRFTGSGMTATPLLDADILHDATDCKTAYQAGNLQLK